jgi:sulfite reductase (NADPH) flavoprotein alpha-component
VRHHLRIDSDGSAIEPAFPAHVSAGRPCRWPTCRPCATDLNDLRELVYPSPGNPQDVFSLRTAQGDGYVDQGNGALLSYQAHDSMRALYELIYQLHTGRASGGWACYSGFAP